MDYGEYTKATIMNPCISVKHFFLHLLYASFVKIFFLDLFYLVGFLGYFIIFLKVSVHFFRKFTFFYHRCKYADKCKYDVCLIPLKDCGSVCLSIWPAQPNQWYEIGAELSFYPTNWKTGGVFYQSLFMQLILIILFTEIKHFNSLINRFLTVSKQNPLIFQLEI